MPKINEQKSKCCGAQLLQKRFTTGYFCSSCKNRAYLSEAVAPSQKAKEASQASIKELAESYRGGYEKGKFEGYQDGERAERELIESKLPKKIAQAKFLGFKEGVEKIEMWARGRMRHYEDSELKIILEKLKQLQEK